MKESWVRPDMEVLDVKETAFGPQNPKMPDSDKTAVIGPNGEVIGWEQSYGEMCIRDSRYNSHGFVCL